MILGKGGLSRYFNLLPSITPLTPQFCKRLTTFQNCCSSIFAMLTVCYGQATKVDKNLFSVSPSKLFVKNHLYATDDYG